MDLGLFRHSGTSLLEREGLMLYRCMLWETHVIGHGPTSLSDADRTTVTTCIMAVSYKPVSVG